MQIVINISEELYTRAGCDDDVMDNTDDMIGILDAICGGKILPEHHGRLIDAIELHDRCVENLLDGKANSPKDYTEFAMLILKQPTILEGTE